MLPVRQPAATLFYHSHVHGRTAEQVYHGLAGALLITDDEEAALGLPSEYGVDDLPLVLQDRQFEQGRLVIPDGMMTLMHGRRGDTLLVNGALAPQARVPAGLVRLRLVNGSNARTWALAFDDGHAFHWIASEGGLLAAPVRLTSLSLAPGERAELVVDFGDGRARTLVTGPDPNAPMMMMRQFDRLRGSEPLLLLRPEGEPRRPSTLPARLVARAGPDASRAVRRRHFNLDMPMGGMMGGMMGGRGMRGGGLGGGAAAFGINGRAFDMRRVDERVRVGDTEIWTFSGDMMAHPIHLHGVHFQVLRRAGGPPALRDQGLRDTVMVADPVDLLMQFTQPSGATPFMYHCHILEHEDNGMMAQFAAT